MVYLFTIRLVLTLIISSGILIAQDFSVLKKNEIKNAKTAVNASYLSENEKQVVMLINLARINVQNFLKPI